MKSAPLPQGSPQGGGKKPDDELLDELPVLDGDDDESDSGLGGDDAEDFDVLPGDAGDDPFDDATGEAEPIAADGSEWLDPVAAHGPAGTSTAADDESEGLDIGDADVADLTDLGKGGWLEAGATDTPEVPDEDPEFSEGESFLAAADAGEEGPMEEGEGLREEDLPSLDADDGGEGEDAHFYDSIAAEDAPLAWSPEPWDPTPVVAHFDIGHVASLSPASRGAVCLGDRLVRVEIDGAVVTLAANGLPESTESVSAEGDVIVVTTAAGVYRSDDGGATFAPTDRAPREPTHDESELVASFESALALPRGFAIAAATEHDGIGLAVIRGVAQGRIYIAERRAGEFLLVADLAEPDSDDVDVAASFDRPDRSESLSDRWVAAWDRARGLLWVGGSFGVFALQPR